MAGDWSDCHEPRGKQLCADCLVGFGRIGVGICWDQWFPECARAMVLAVFGLLAATGFGEKLWGGLVILLASVGTATAGYQTWLQLQPPGSASCAGSNPNLIEQLVYFLSDNIPSLFEVSGLCEDEELVILGLSLANWALVSFLAAVIAAVWALRLRKSA